MGAKAEHQDGSPTTRTNTPMSRRWLKDRVSGQDGDSTYSSRTLGRGAEQPGPTPEGRDESSLRHQRTGSP